MLAAPVVGLDRKRRGFLVERHLVVVDGNLEVLTGNSLVHDNSCKGIYRIAGVEDIVHEKDLVPCSQVFGRISPSVDLNAGLITENIVGACNHSGIENRSSVLFHAYHLVVFGKDIGHVDAASERNIDDIGNEMVFRMHLVCELQSAVSDYVVRDELLHAILLRAV